MNLQYRRRQCSHPLFGATNAVVERLPRTTTVCVFSFLFFGHLTSKKGPKLCRAARSRSTSFKFFRRLGPLYASGVAVFGTGAPVQHPELLNSWACAAPAACCCLSRTIAQRLDLDLRKDKQGLRRERRHFSAV